MQMIHEHEKYVVNALQAIEVRDEDTREFFLGNRFVHGTSVAGGLGRTASLATEAPFTRLAQANGWGSAGQCPARHDAKTPAVRERACHVVAAAGNGSDVLPRASAQGAPREAVV